MAESALSIPDAAPMPLALAAQWERLRQSLVQARNAQHTTPIGWALAVWFAWGKVPLQAMGLWLGIFFVALVVILFSLLHLQKQREDVASTCRHYQFLAGLDGLSWGMMAPLLMGYDGLLDTWLATLLCGVAAVNAPVHIMFMRAYGLQLLGIWIPTAAHALIHLHEPNMPNLLVGMSVFFSLLFYYMRGLGNSVNRKVLLVLENQALTAQLKVALSGVEQQASTDPLTGVANRRAMSAMMANQQQVFERQLQPYSVLMMDIDHFKSINDLHGHAMGDEILKAFCARVASALRPTDRLARYGGEEFVAIIPSAGLDEACMVAQRVCQAVANQPVIQEPDRAISITVSIGVAACAAGLSVDQLIEAADSAVYAAKRQGRNRVCSSAAHPALAAA